MRPQIQEGIYYLKGTRPPNSFCMVFLDVTKNSNAKQVGEALKVLWDMLQNLKMGIVADLDIKPKLRVSGNLTVLIGFGSNIFAIPGAKKNEPSGLKSPWTFLHPQTSGAKKIVDGCNLLYAADVQANRSASSYIVVQLIADQEFFTNRGLVEIWKALKETKRNNGGTEVLTLNHFYFGHRREDYRSWLGFHDGISNIPSEKRFGVVAIDQSLTPKEENWLVGGTYLAFMRMSVNLECWLELSRSNQEIVIGRDKLTGCSLIGIDQYDKPVKDPRCPIVGTDEITEPGNEFFREHPPYGQQRNLPRGVSDEALKLSHIGRTRPLDKNQVWKANSLSIFRQGFEFLESIDGQPGFRVGLNFVSFQNTSEKFFKSLTYGFMAFELKSKEGVPLPKLEDYLSVRDVGVFIVPPVSKNESFPGANIFFDEYQRVRT